MRLNETEMVKLLPAWMQEDGSDKGIATGCDIISRDAYARLKLLSRWDKTRTRTTPSTTPTAC